MTIELQMLGAATILGFVYLFAAIIVITRQRGRAWNIGTREGPTAPLTGMAFRLDQAFQNFRETFPLFAAAVLAVQAGGKWSTLSMVGVHLYFWARVVYLPVYAYGINGVRTAVWLVSVIGIFLLLAALLLPVNGL
jgi:uncharacterized MAPEG superfamily protein